MKSIESRRDKAEHFGTVKIVSPRTNFCREFYLTHVTCVRKTIFAIATEIILLPSRSISLVKQQEMSESEQDVSDNIYY